MSTRMHTDTVLFMARTLGSYVTEKRESLGLNQTELSNRANVPRTTVNRIENGTTQLPSADIRRRLAAALGVSHLDLLVAAGEITEQELGTTVGIVEHDPDDPRQRFIRRLERLRWTDGMARSLEWVIGTLEREQGIVGDDGKE